MNETQSYHRSCLYYPLAVARRQYLLTFFNVKKVGTIEEIVINRDRITICWIDLASQSAERYLLCFYYYCLIYSYIE